MGHRKRPSLHILFKEFAKRDKIEIWANQRGEKIIPWARNALIKQAQDENAWERLQRDAYHSVFEALTLLREMAGPEATERARRETEEYIDWVKDDAAKNFK